jgi:hypothetical protein
MGGYMTLFEECIEALQPMVEILPLDKRTYYSKMVSENFPIQLNGGIDWRRVNKKYEVSSYDEIITYLKNILGEFDETVYILWDGAHLPTIKANITKVIEKIDDVTAVGFDTWVISPSNRYVIEFYHEGEITIGFY